MQLPPPPPPIPEPGSRCRRHSSYGRRHRHCRHHRLRSGPGKDVVAALRASRKRLFSLQSSTVSAARLPGAPTRSPFSGGGRGPSRHRPSPLPAGPAPPREARASLSEGRTGAAGHGWARLGCGLPPAAPLLGAAPACSPRARSHPSGPVNLAPLWLSKTAV